MNNQVSKGSVEPNNTHTTAVTTTGGTDRKKTASNDTVCGSIAKIGVGNMYIDTLFDCVRYIGEQYHAMTVDEKEIALKFLSECEGSVCSLCRAIKDLEKMCENIRNDFPIELGTKLNETVEYMQQRNDETEKMHAAEILEMCDTMLYVHEETGHNRLYELAVEKLGQNNVIARKRVLVLKISTKEIDYLIKQIQLKS